jgi:XTP/dITP diphosphohydrolase
MKLVFATHNQNKFKEVKALMPSYIELLSLTDIGCFEDIPETAKTIEGNAAIKANYVRDFYEFDCFADDTGLEITSLNYEPGVYSARYAGPENDSNANMKKVLEGLDGKPNREAFFKTAIALTFKGVDVMFLGVCEGAITEKEKGEGGFGYDPIFQPLGFLETFAQMTLEQKSEIGHRGKAIKQLIEYLSE